MNRKEAIVVALIISLTFMSYAFADTVTTSRTGATLQTTSTDIEVVKFAGVSTNLGNAYNPLTAGILVGNLTATFSFTPNAVFQQVNSVKALIIYQAGQAFNSCQSCGQPGDRFNFQLNGQAVGGIHPGNSNIPFTSVVTLSGLRSGSNVINISVSNLTDPFAGFYYVYELRLTVEYTYLA